MFLTDAAEILSWQHKTNFFSSDFSELFDTRNRFFPIKSKQIHHFHYLKGDGKNNI